MISSKKLPSKLMMCAFRRGGSSVIFEALQHLFIHSGFKTVDIVADKHNQDDEKTVSPKDLNKAIYENDLIGCFRSPPPPIYKKNINNVCIILIVRDPRDCILSWYYASRLHKIPKITSNLEDYLINDDLFKNDINDLIAYSNDKNAHIFKYEDIVLDPMSFLNNITKNLSLVFTRDSMDWAAAHLNCLQPQILNSSHNRSGKPYGWINQLDNKIANLLTCKFDHILETLKYPLAPVAQDVSLRLEIDSLKRLILNLAYQNSLKDAHLIKINEKINELLKK